jgi:hypothetical protein
MGTTRYEYKIEAHTNITDKVVHEFLEIFETVFGESITAETVRMRMKEKSFILAIHASLDQKVVAFKTGYALSPQLFYSWIGGVDPDHRRNGLALRLMSLQHTVLAILRKAA